MSLEISNRTLSWDWYPGSIPENVVLEDDAYLETTYSFLLYRSRASQAVRIGHAATIYLGTMFDVGPEGRVQVGEFALVHGAWIICDALVEIGDYSLISWNVVLMDSYRLPRDIKSRRRALEQIPNHPLRCADAQVEARPIRIGRNVWIGFECCVLPGVTIGDGSIVGARSVVVENVPPYTVVAGNPARVIRNLENDEARQIPERGIS
jgi:acetyltransferase-like isoleucine patch superfamily enzyme